jgi:hypothetical protein
MARAREHRDRADLRSTKKPAGGFADVQGCVLEGQAKRLEAKEGGASSPSVLGSDNIRPNFYAYVPYASRRGKGVCQTRERASG